MRKGFTLVEVSLFLALSGALILIVIAGTSRSIAEKRYNDTVDNLASYLQGLYSSVNYVSHNGKGNSSKAVYGKLVDMKTDNKKTKFTAYTILGDIDVSKAKKTDTLKAVLELGPTITDSSGAIVSKETYIPTWGGEIKADQDKDHNNNDSQILLLILTNPHTNMISTYVYYPSESITIESETEGIKRLAGDDNALVGENGNNFKKQDANFCIDSDDRWAGSPETRRMIQIHSGANNASGVEIIANDKKDGLCL